MNSLCCNNKSKIHFKKILLTIIFAVFFTKAETRDPPVSSLNANEKYLVKKVFNELQNHTRYLLTTDKFIKRTLLPQTFGYEGMLTEFNEYQCALWKEVEEDWICPKKFRDFETIKAVLSNKTLFDAMFDEINDPQETEDWIEFFMRGDLLQIGGQG